MSSKKQQRKEAAEKRRQEEQKRKHDDDSSDDDVVEESILNKKLKPMEPSEPITTTTTTTRTPSNDTARPPIQLNFDLKISQDKKTPVTTEKPGIIETPRIDVNVQQISKQTSEIDSEDDSGQQQQNPIVIRDDEKPSVSPEPSLNDDEEQEEEEEEEVEDGSEDDDDNEVEEIKIRRKINKSEEEEEEIKIPNFSFSQHPRSKPHTRKMKFWNRKFYGFGDLINPFISILEQKEDARKTRYICNLCQSIDDPNYREEIDRERIFNHILYNCERKLVPPEEKDQVQNILSRLENHIKEYVKRKSKKERSQDRKLDVFRERIAKYLVEVGLDVNNFNLDAVRAFIHDTQKAPFQKVLQDSEQELFQLHAIRHCRDNYYKTARLWQE